MCHKHVNQFEKLPKNNIILSTTSLLLLQESIRTVYSVVKVLFVCVCVSETKKNLVQDKRKLSEKMGSTE